MGVLQSMSKRYQCYAIVLSFLGVVTSYPDYSSKLTAAEIFSDTAIVFSLFIGFIGFFCYLKYLSILMQGQKRAQTNNLK